MSSFRVEVVTPAGGVVLDREASHLQLPGEAGSFGILAAHADLMASLGTGIAELQSGGETLQFTVSGGFARVTGGNVMVLAESAELADKINLERAEAARVRAEARLKEGGSELDHARAELALAKAINRIKLAGTR
jgi:F-type H+-transporting ATPase subunit epsilon